MKNKIILLVIMTLLIGGCLSTKEPSKNDIVDLSNPIPVDNLDAREDLIFVHYINVGQGDATFIELPHSGSILIDAGPRGAGDDVVRYIKALGYDTISYFVLTHQDADHIGGAQKVINNFHINSMFYNGQDKNTTTWQLLKEDIGNNKIPLINVNDDTPLYTQYVTINFIVPYDTDGGSVKYLSDDNDNSVILKVDYQAASFLFMGDCGVDCENALINDVDSINNIDFFKVGHHGSRTASSERFIKKVSPDYCIISAGIDNGYGHPHPEVIQTLRPYCQLLGTHIQGNIIVQTDGSDGFTVYGGNNQYTDAEYKNGGLVTNGLGVIGNETN